MQSGSSTAAAATTAAAAVASGFRNLTCELAESAELGRYVRASRPIKAGELLLCEEPVVIGPYWDSVRCCLNCYAESTTMCTYVAVNSVVSLVDHLCVVCSSVCCITA